MSFILEGLTEAAQQALPFARGLLEADPTLSANAVLDAVRAVGLGLRRKAGLDMVRRIKGVFESRPYVDALKRNVLPDPSRLAPAPYLKMRTQYHYLVEAAGVDVNTLEATTRNITIATNAVLTKQQAMDMAIEHLVSTQPSGGVGISKISVTDIFVNPTGVII